MLHTESFGKICFKRSTRWNWCMNNEYVMHLYIMPADKGHECMLYVIYTMHLWCNPFSLWIIQRRHNKANLYFQSFVLADFRRIIMSGLKQFWWLGTLGRFLGDCEQIKENSVITKLCLLGFVVILSTSMGTILGERVFHSTRLSLLGQELRFARHWVLPALHLCSANPFALICFSILWLSRVDPGSLLTPCTDSWWSKGMGLLKTSNSSTCGTSVSLQRI